MDSIQTRLRRTFKHDDDEDDNDDGHNHSIALDDVQQESVIISFQESAQSTDLLYTRILTVFSFIAIVPFFLLALSSSLHLSLLTKAAITTAVLSLLLTAWITSFVPPATTATTPGLSPWWMPFHWPAKKNASGSRKQSPSASSAGLYGGYDYDYDYDYLAQILTWLNLAVVSVLFVIGSYLTLYATGPVGGSEAVYDSLASTAQSPSLFLTLSLLLPGVMFAAVSMVRQSMADVLSGVRDLHGLRYELKGA